MNIYVDVHESSDGGNSTPYCHGWLARFFGLPMAPPAPNDEPPFTPHYLERFCRGWLACQDVPAADRYEALMQALSADKVVAYWVDANNVELQY